MRHAVHPRRIVAWLLLAALPACGEPAASGGLEGVYQLVTLNSQPLPYNHAQGCCIYTAGSLTLGASNYGVTITMQTRSNGMVATVNEDGTYTPNGTALAFQRTGGSFVMYLFNAQVTGRTIRVQLGGNGPGAADQFPAAFRR